MRRFVDAIELHSARRRRTARQRASTWSGSRRTNMDRGGRFSSSAKERTRRSAGYGEGRSWRRRTRTGRGRAADRPRGRRSRAGLLGRALARLRGGDGDLPLPTPYPLRAGLPTRTALKARPRPYAHDLPLRARSFLELARQAPAYGVRLGSDLERIGRALRRCPRGRATSRWLLASWLAQLLSPGREAGGGGEALRDGPTRSAHGAGLPSGLRLHARARPSRTAKAFGELMDRAARLGQGAPVRARRRSLRSSRWDANLAVRALKLLPEARAGEPRRPYSARTLSIAPRSLPNVGGPRESRARAPSSSGRR